MIPCSSKASFTAATTAVWASQRRLAEGASIQKRRSNNTAEAPNSVSAASGRGVDSTDRVTVRAGAGIVADSDPAGEFRETERKMEGVLAALSHIGDEQVSVDAGGGGP